MTISIKPSELMNGTPGDNCEHSCLPGPQHCAPGKNFDDTRIPGLQYCAPGKVLTIHGDPGHSAVLRVKVRRYAATRATALYTGTFSKRCERLMLRLDNQSEPSNDHWQGQGN